MKKKFAEGLSFYKLFIIFIVASIIGAYYEQILCCVKHYINNGEFFWHYHRGVIYGPFNIIYGVGAAIMAKLLVPKKKNWKTVFLASALLGGLVEYILCFLQETFLGTVSWDYSDKFLNINGRTTIPYMLFWGLLGLVLVYLIYPIISKCIESIPYSWGTIICNILVVLMALDMTVSFTAVIRQALRRQGLPAFTTAGKLCDKYYTDEFLARYYTNARLVK